MDLTKDDVVTKEDLTKTDVDVTKNDVTKEDVVTKEDLVKRERKAFSLGKKCSDIFREIKQMRKRQKMFYSAHLRATNSLDQRMFNLEREVESLNKLQSWRRRICRKNGTSSGRSSSQTAGLQDWLSQRHGGGKQTLLPPFLNELCSFVWWIENKFTFSLKCFFIYFF